MTARRTTKNSKKRPATRASRPRKTAADRSRRRAPPADTGSGVAPGMQAVSPYLAVANVRASMQFLESSLGFAATVALADGDGQLRYAEMRRGQTAVMLIRKGDGTMPGGGAAALYTYVDDVDAAVARARDLGAGCGVTEDTAWGDRAAVVTDPDGYRWVVATFKKLVPFVTPPSD